ncbi:hypothetical protein M3I54_42890 [Paraburkholderia sp. CNPSo 3274]|uniref:hypothetical protein n=1 Tax=Paraburkholderia sp. CNPSo 3274 TaxID=2940932 RepID=UPI0020B6AD6D|nr:hypothetical protein [Paraburkholderia sp. CNPSo 3274]MCP3713509.1 hypothetical protein [Paraburkholderia sp. CNPSo 3274]
MTIPDLKNAWEAMRSAAKKGNTDEAEHLLNQFVLAAKWSPDLVPQDAARLAKKGEDQPGSLQPKTTVLGSNEIFVVEFSSLDLYERYEISGSRTGMFIIDSRRLKTREFYSVASVTDAGHPVGGKA